MEFTQEILFMILEELRKLNKHLKVGEEE